MITTLKPAKAKANKWFSLFIRTRDALITTGTLTRCLCVTCGRMYPIKQHGGLQAGHFIQGRHPSVLFDERNCHAQCYGCNVMKKGNMVKYYKFMLENYGQEVIDELEALDRQVKPMKVYMYLEIADTYKKKLKELEDDFKKHDLSVSNEGTQ
jgi:hypothetical protein